MTHKEAEKDLIRYRLESAEESIASAWSEARAGRGRFAINRAYYACFYAASAVLLQKGKKFVKHTGVREAVHRDLIIAGLIAKEFGQTYDRLFTARHEADYGEIIHVDKQKVQYDIKQAEQFVAEIKRLLNKG